MIHRENNFFLILISHCEHTFNPLCVIEVKKRKHDFKKVGLEVIDFETKEFQRQGSSFIDTFALSIKR